MFVSRLLKILWISLFFSVAIGGIFRETTYYYQTPGAYYAETGEKQEISSERYNRGSRGNYPMYYSQENTFNESLAIQSFIVLFLITSLFYIILGIRKKR